MAILTFVSCTALAYGDPGVEVAGQVQPTVCLSQRVVHPSLSWVSCNRWIICRVQNTRSKQGQCYNLARLIDYELLSEKSPIVDRELGSGMPDVEGCCLAVIVKCLLEY